MRNLPYQLLSKCLSIDELHTPNQKVLKINPGLRHPYCSVLFEHEIKVSSYYNEYINIYVYIYMQYIKTI